MGDSGRVNSSDGAMSMLRILSKQTSGIKICHINAQSLNNKIDEFRFIFEGSSVDVICVSETWLKQTTPNSMIYLQGYKTFRADRKTRGGGVAIFLKNTIKCNLISMSTSTTSDSNLLPNLNGIEHIFIEIVSFDKKLLVGCVYRPNCHIPTRTFVDYLGDISLSYTDLVIAGDFNSNLLTDASLIDDISAIGIEPINRFTPTHFTTSSNSLLDLFLTNDNSKVQLYDQLSVPCFSKHDLIFTAFDFRLIHEEQTFTYRDFKHIDYHLLDQHFTAINWDSIYYMPSADEKLSFLENNISYLYNLHVPIRTKTIKPNTRPWFSSAIKRLIEKRDLAYSRWKRFKTTLLKDIYRNARSEVNREIRKAKTNYYAEKFNNAISTKKTWSTIREIGIGKTENTIQCNVTAGELNTIFTNIPSTNDDILTRDYLNAIVDTTFHRVFEFRCVNTAEVLKCFERVKSNAIGYDNLDPRFIRILLPRLLPFMTHLFNTIITTSLYPSTWKFAKIIPIPKSNSEFRPIAILSYLSKVLEKLLHAQINEYINEFNLLTPFQSGFRAKHSCITTLINLCEDLRFDIDSGNINILVLLDHSKAFDSVDHTLLLTKLHKLFNFSSTSNRLLSSYLSNRFQLVFLNGDYSSPLAVTKGVPQGSILGPLLFSLYINDLPKYLRHCKIHLYADDVQIYLGSSLQHINESIFKINYDLNNIYKWATANKLLINPQKSKYLVIHKKSVHLNINFELMLNNEKIQCVSSAKNLGVIFNNNLDWSTHINKTSASLYLMLRNLWPTQYMTPLKIRILIAKTYLMPRLIYACEVFANFDFNSKYLLQKTFNNIVRYVYGLRRYDRVSLYSKKLYGISLENIMNLRKLIMLHKIIYTKKPLYLYDRLNFTRSNRGNNLIPMRYHCHLSEYHFFIYSTRLWNSLPNHLQMNSNAKAFGKLLNQYFVSQVL